MFNVHPNLTTIPNSYSSPSLSSSRSCITSTCNSASALQIIAKRQMVVIRHLPRSDNMCSREERAQNETKTTDDNVCDTQEVVLASDDAACGDEDFFCTAIFCDWEVCEAS